MRLFQNILLLISTIILFFIIAEIITRLNEDLSFYDNTVYLQKADVQVHMASTNPALSYELVPLATDPARNISINSKGIRDKEYEIPKPKNIFRIIILGDSITFGFNCELSKTYPKLLEQKLNKDSLSIINYEVLNAGVYAYNAMQKIIFLKTKLLQYEPDLVIFQFYNDDYQQTALLNNNYFDVPPEEFYPKMSNREIFSENMARLLPLSFKLNKKILKCSAFYRFLMMRYYNLLSKIDPIKYYPNAYKFLGSKYALAYNKDAFRVLNELSKSMKFKILIVAFPDLFNEDRNDSYVRIEPKRLYGIDTLDLYREFKNRIKDLSLLKINPHDACHLNVLGHKLSAEIIFSFLLKKHLITGANID